MSHIHFPMQSGSDTILKAMRRPYKNAKFIEICEKMKAARPDLAITTDIIVGTVQKVLCEGPSKHNPSTLSGRTPQNKIVIFEGDESKLTGEILDIAVKESTGFTTYGTVI